MALIDALERRSHPSNPDRWWINHVNGAPSASGVNVNEETALSATAVSAAVRVISETLAMLPLKLKEHVDDRTKRDARTLGLYNVLKLRPNPEQTSFEFRRLQQGFLLLWGNCYAQKVYNGRGEVIELWPLTPWRVTPQRTDSQALVYRVKLPGNKGGEEFLPADDVLHIQGFSSNGLLGDNAVERFRNAIGLSLAAEEFGGGFFGRGLAPSGVLLSDKVLGPEGRKNLHDSVTGTHGGVGKTHRLMILEEGVKWLQTSIDPEKAQALETRKFQVTEVARIFNLPPHLLKDLERATFTNIEHQGQEFVTYCLQPWIENWEQRMNVSLLLPSQQSRFFTKFEVEGLLRGDSAARAAFFTAMVNIGVYSINDVRMKDDLPPITGGDQHFVQGAMVPLDKIAAMVEAQMEAKKNPPQPFGQPKADEDEEVGEPKEPRSIRRPDPTLALEPVIRNEADRIVRRQVNAVRGAMKKPAQEFRVWADKFFEKEVGLLEESLAPALLAMTTLSGTAIDARAFALLDTDRALAEVRKAIVAPDESEARLNALVTRWESERAGALTSEIVQREPAPRAA